MVFYRVEYERVDLTAESVNRTYEKIGPESFELLKVLGKGGYGKVLIALGLISKDHNCHLSPIYRFFK